MVPTRRPPGAAHSGPRLAGLHAGQPAAPASEREIRALGLGHLCAALQHDKLRSGDRLVGLVDRRRRDLVEFTAEKQRRRHDRSEVHGDVEILNGPITWKVVVDLSRFADGVEGLQRVGPGLDAAEVAVVEDHHRRLVLVAVGRPLALVAPQGALDLRWDSARSRSISLSQNGTAAGRSSTAPMSTGVGHAEHAAPRVADHVGSVESEGTADRVDFLEVELERPHRRVGACGSATAELQPSWS